MKSVVMPALVLWSSAWFEEPFLCSQSCVSSLKDQTSEICKNSSWNVSKLSLQLLAKNMFSIKHGQLPLKLSSHRMGFFLWTKLLNCNYATFSIDQLEMILKKNISNICVSCRLQTWNTCFCLKALFFILTSSEFAVIGIETILLFDSAQIYLKFFWIDG